MKRDNEETERRRAAARAEWLERRRHGIGGSDMAAVLGISPWKTPLSVWLEKTGRKAPQPSTLRMDIGTALEPLAAARYTAETGRRVRKCNILLRGADLPGASGPDCRVGNVDRLCVLPDGGLPYRRDGVHAERALEIKTSSDLAEWDRVPDHYVAQAQHYMGLMPTVRAFDFPVIFLARGTMRIYTVERDDGVIRDMAVAANEFWRRYVEADTPPPAASEEDARALYPRAEAGKKAVASAEVEQAALALRDLTATIKDMEGRAAALKATLQEAMGDAETLVLPDGTRLATWKSGKPLSKTDWKAAFEELAAHETPGWIAECTARHTAEAPAPRRFLLAAAH